MQKEYLEEEHIMFQETVREFFTKEVAPFEAQWEKDGQVSREIWKRAGDLGILAIDIPEEYGGLGLNDYRYNAIVLEEMSRANITGTGFGTQNEIVVPYLNHYCTPEQKAKFFPKMAAGEWIGALAMSEPAAGSDLKGIRSTAIKQGDHYILNGSKIFITNGIMCDFAVTAVKTNPELGSKGFALLLVESTFEGFTKGKNLDKIGMKSQDTAELFFDNVKVPVENLLGEDGKGFYYMMHNLPQERLSIAFTAIGAMEGALEWTIQYCQERKAFGRSIGTFQNSRFKLAEMSTEITIARTFVDKCAIELNEKRLTAEKAAMAKYWLTDLQFKIMDDCLQLHGGYGYMNEFAIAKAWRDARVQRIYGGTNEIMKEIIGRSLGF
mgnify:CR=1 FL=1